MHTSAPVRSTPAGLAVPAGPTVPAGRVAGLAVPAVPAPRPWPDHRPSRRTWSCERGTVTAETAVLLPVLLVVLAAAVGVLACVAAQLECVDAARAAARAASRGDGPADVRLTGERLAPSDARVSVSAQEGTVEVVVSAQVRPFGRLLRLPAVPVSGRAVAAVEPGAG